MTDGVGTSKPEYMGNLAMVTRTKTNQSSHLFPVVGIQLVPVGKTTWADTGAKGVGVIGLND